MLSLGMVLNSQSGPSSTFFLFVPSELFSVWKSLNGAKKNRTLFFALIELLSMPREAQGVELKRRKKLGCLPHFFPQVDILNLGFF
jgi:hypothetical protein